MWGAFQPVPVGRRLARRRFFRPHNAGDVRFIPAGAPDLTAMGPASMAARIVVQGRAVEAGGQKQDAPLTEGVRPQRQISVLRI
jgi:hypothetical protein